MVYTIGGVSGCHINPAISISMLVAGKLSIKDTIFYVVFQCIGAIIGAGILYAIASGNPAYSLAVIRFRRKRLRKCILQLIIL